MKDTIYVGIGASAGGLKALQQFVARLPENSNMVYIIAQHLLSDKKSALAEILSRQTSLAVSEISPSTKFLRNHIYILPPGHNLVVKNHRLSLEKANKASHHPTPSADILFESLALFAKRNAVGILLSGSGHDGTLGMKKIKEHGGVTLAQSLEEAQYDGMPKNAMDAEVVDCICSVTEMVENILRLLDKNALPLTPLLSIEKILRIHKNLDLRRYKEETVIRRIHKRMMLLHLSDIQTYAHYLSEHPEETDLLYQDILIGVTAFFRDYEAYKALEETLLHVLEEKPSGSEFRVWCAACSSGEEAYSLAILIDQISKRLRKTFNVRIFATDIDDEALNTARLAQYSASAVEAMDTSLRDHYFTPFDQGYKVNASLRKDIVFTHHNLLQDPPFINQDIISCRNLLIYLLPLSQKEIFALFHYSLKPHGILFLGSSESTLLSLDYFTPLDSRYKIYQKELLQNPPKISSHYFSKHLDQKTLKMSASFSSDESLNIEDQMRRTIFDFFAPHCLIVDQNLTIIYKKGDIPVLKMRDGIPSLALLRNLDETLRHEIKALLDRAFSTMLPESTKFIELSGSDQTGMFIKAIAHPFVDLHDTPMVLLYFQELTAEDLQFNAGSPYLPDESMMLKNVSEQLISAREEIRTLSDELTLIQETAQLMNEELQSSNEELQSSNEELETANEELQSSNEELHSSIGHIEKLKQQLTLLFDSSLDGIIGVDINGRHTFVNLAAAQMLGYTPNELIGKDSHSLWHHTKPDGTPYPVQECPTYQTMRDGKHLRREDLLWRKDGTRFEVDLLQSPIVENGKITGAVLSFHDITDSKRKEEIMIAQSRQAAMGDMLAMIAHQWRQPLSIISMSTSTLKAYLELEEAIAPQEMQHLIVTINEQAHYLSHTIDDFRNFFKPDNVKEKTTLTAIFERLATLVQKSMENNAIALKFPTTNGEIAIFTYPNQLLQSLINIITNAKDAIKEHHTIQGVIHISLSVKPEEIIIEICDNGGGIDPSITKKIGEPYVTTKASNGTGLGLYMSKIIIEKHLGGRLWWSSDATGSCFSIALPKGSLK